MVDEGVAVSTCSWKKNILKSSETQSGFFLLSIQYLHGWMFFLALCNGK